MNTTFDINCSSHQFIAVLFYLYSHASRIKGLSLLKEDFCANLDVLLIRTRDKVATAVRTLVPWAQIAVVRRVIFKRATRARERRLGREFKHEGKVKVVWVGLR